MNLLKSLLFIPVVFGFNSHLYEFVDKVGINDIKLINQTSLEQRKFPCPTDGKYRSKHRPTDVNHLKVGDIDIVGAIGDSLTAGFAAEANHSWKFLQKVGACHGASVVNIHGKKASVHFPISSKCTTQT